MRILRLLLCLAICAAVPAGASPLKGIVLENELGGPPAAGVAITASGANPFTTHNDGQFTLEFPDLRPGHLVRVSADKPGYVVVNDLQLEQTLPADPNARPLVLLICRPASREEMARRFFRLKSL